MLLFTNIGRFCVPRHDRERHSPANVEQDVSISMPSIYIQHQGARRSIYKSGTHLQQRHIWSGQAEIKNCRVLPLF